MFAKYLGKADQTGDAYSRVEWSRMRRQYVYFEYTSFEFPMSDFRLAQQTLFHSFGLNCLLCNHNYQNSSWKFKVVSNVLVRQFFAFSFVFMYILRTRLTLGKYICSKGFQQRLLNLKKMYCKFVKHCLKVQCFRFTS